MLQFTIGLLLMLAFSVVLVLFVRHVYDDYLRDSFRRSYHIDLGKSIAICKTREEGNFVSLHYPQWRYPNMDGSRDGRRTGNSLMYSDSFLRVEGFLVKSKEPIQIVWLMNTLRARGVRIGKTRNEKKKYEKCIKENRKQSSITCLDDIRERYPSQGFEEYCAQLFRAEGCRADVTRATGDGGHDIEVAYPSGETAIVECKCYKSNVGEPVLRSLCGSNACAHADRMILITTAGFTQQAKEYAHAVGIELVDGDALLARLRAAGMIDPNRRIEPDLGEWQLTWYDVDAMYPPDVNCPYIDTNAVCQSISTRGHCVRKGVVPWSSWVILVLLVLLVGITLFTSWKTFCLLPNAGSSDVAPSISGVAEYVLPQSASRYYTHEELEALSTDEVNIAINELYARHGRIFLEEEYSSYFESKSWYRPLYEPQEYEQLAEPFNEFEQANLSELALIRSEREG